MRPLEREPFIAGASLDALGESVVRHRRSSSSSSGSSSGSGSGSAAAIARAASSPAASGVRAFAAQQDFRSTSPSVESAFGAQSKSPHDYLDGALFPPDSGLRQDPPELRLADPVPSRSTSPRIPLGRSSSSPRLAGLRLSTDLNGSIASPLSSPGLNGPSHLIPTSESPPKKRSFIEMPPRSGYELSDDPDDVGSEDDDAASSGSGRESTGTMEEDEGEADDVDEEVENLSEEEIDERDYSSEGQRRSQRSLADEEDDRLARHLHMSQKQAHIEDDASDNTGSEEDSDEDPDSSRIENYGEEREQGEGEPKGAMAIIFKQQRRPAPIKRPSLIRSSAVTMPPPPESLPEGGESATEGKEAGSGPPPALDLTEVGGAQLPATTPAAAAAAVASAAEENDKLSPLERIFLFAKSELAYHRELVSRSLPEWILEVELNDAVEYIIPLLNGLGTDGEWIPVSKLGLMLT